MRKLWNSLECLGRDRAYYATLHDTGSETGAGMAAAYLTESEARVMGLLAIAGDIGATLKRGAARTLVATVLTGTVIIATPETANMPTSDIIYNPSETPTHYPMPVVIPPGEDTNSQRPINV